MSTVKENISARETFAGLYEEYLPKVFRYIQYRVSDIQMTEDLTSTVFEKALVNFNRYSKDKAGFSTWLFSIARNTVTDYYRAQGRRKTVPLDDADDTASDDPSPDEELARAEERKKLRESLAKLSGAEREIISLKFGAALNNRQIAGVLGLSESNVGTRLYRTLRKLREGFQEPASG